MASVVVTLKIMPESPNSDLEAIKKKATLEIETFGGKVGKEIIEPVAFGLNSLSLMFIMNENIGSTEELEKNVEKIKDVGSVQITDVRRAIG